VTGAIETTAEVGPHTLHPAHLYQYYWV
jgi:hypothetical protein